MDASTSDTTSDIDDYKISEEDTSESTSDDSLGSLGTSGPPSHAEQQQPPLPQPSDSDSSQYNAGIGREIIRSPAGTSALFPPAQEGLFSEGVQAGSEVIQSQGRSSRHRRRLRGLGHHNRGAITTRRAGDVRVRDLISRPRCGLNLLRALKSDKQLCIPEPRTNPRFPPRQPGTVDKLFAPRDGDLLMRHVKKAGKRVVEFFDPEQPADVSFEDGDYLLRFKVENFSLMHQSFVTARGYLYHHGHWVYLGKDADQMELL